MLVVSPQPRVTLVPMLLLCSLCVSQWLVRYWNSCVMKLAASLPGATCHRFCVVCCVCTWRGRGEQFINFPLSPLIPSLTHTQAGREQRTWWGSLAQCIHALWTPMSKLTCLKHYVTIALFMAELWHRWSWLASHSQTFYIHLQFLITCVTLPISDTVAGDVWHCSWSCAFPLSTFVWLSLGTPAPLRMWKYSWSWDSA